MTMVDGKILVEDGMLKTADLGEIIAEIHKVAPGHFSRRAAFLAENADGTVQWTQNSQ
jgi:5-methylthioadenosine/S-adenosylhomocysteine deaminase